MTPGGSPAGIATTLRDAPGAEIRLSVASFNERGIKVYRRSGFRVVRNFVQVTNGGEYDFVEMRRDA